MIQRMCSQKHYFVHGETFLLIGINGAESEIFALCNRSMLLQPWSL